MDACRHSLNAVSAKSGSSSEVRKEMYFSSLMGHSSNAVIAYRCSHCSLLSLTFMEMDKICVVSQSMASLPSALERSHPQALFSSSRKAFIFHLPAGSGSSIQLLRENSIFPKGSMVWRNTARCSFLKAPNHSFTEVKRMPSKLYSADVVYTENGAIFSAGG